MDHNNTHHESRDDTERVEPGELFEDCWFFDNLLHRKSRMLRSLSEPCTSSNYGQDENLPEKSYEETYRSIEKLSIRDRKTEGKSLIKDQKIVPQRSKRSNKNKKSSRCLNRAPSLPTSLEPEEFEDDEIEFSMGKLIRQASMNYSDTLPPRAHSTKILTPSPSMTRQRSIIKPEVEGSKIEGTEKITRPQRPTNQLRKQRSVIELESEEFQGFKDLGFDFDEEELSMIWGLSDKKDIQEDEGKSSRVRRLHSSEAWSAQSRSAPPVMWGGKRSTEDVKAQIKFWARAVASNVRQEC
ncbi:hypothetical protein STAS_30956 [Striga asiatica]|uniref:Uncharacterized protein n=1 Tax=Striga asiatica TaxID=4170 RepID=A0A5A7R7N7_STRAF|nr:hypothetical protein STAS_30956 [Striga asiatica]